jgi:fructokinase
MDLICLGIILVDMFPVEVGKPLVEVSSFTPKPGGAPANVAVAARRMGSGSAFIGKVGQDIFGNWLKQVLDHEDVDTSGMVFDNEARTSLVFIGMPDEHHAEFVFYRNPGADMRLTEQDLNITLLRETKALHIDSLSLTNTTYKKATLKAIDIVRKSGGLISYDVNYRPTMWDTPEQAITTAKEIIPLCDILKLNDDELELITGQPDPKIGGEIILTMGGKLCLVTLGEKGSHYITPYHHGFIPAFKVNTIDSVGCGDAFLGAMLHKLLQFDSLETGLQKENITKVLKFAAAAGALTATKRGALPAIPYRDEVDRFLEKFDNEEDA